MRTVMTLTLVCTFVGASTPAESFSFAAEGTGLGEQAEPAGFTVDRVQYGIASKYVRDEGLEGDPDVILFEQFEVESLSAQEAEGWVPRHGPGLWKDGTGEKLGWKYYEITAAPDNRWYARPGFVVQPYAPPNFVLVAWSCGKSWVKLLQVPAAQ